VLLSGDDFDCVCGRFSGGLLLLSKRKFTMIEC
jgi:hypothetical protein